MILTWVVIGIGVFGVAIYYYRIKKNSDVGVDARTWSKLSWRSLRRETLWTGRRGLIHVLTT